MCSRTAPLFRSWLVKMSSGNSCIAEEEKQMTKVTTRWQPFGEVTRPPPRQEEPYMLFSEEVYTELDWMLY